MNADNAAPDVVNEVPAEDVPQVFYKIVSNDNVTVEMSAEAIKQTKTLNDLVSRLGVTNDSIPVNNVNGATLKLVAEWCEQHKGEPIPVDDDNLPLNIVIPAWDREFLKITNEHWTHRLGNGDKTGEGGGEKRKKTTTRDECKMVD